METMSSPSSVFPSRMTLVAAQAIPSQSLVAGETIVAGMASFRIGQLGSGQQPDDPGAQLVGHRWRFRQRLLDCVDQRDLLHGALGGDQLGVVGFPITA